MQILTLDSGYTVRYYTDLDEFPAERRAWLTRYQLEAAEIDTTPAGLADRIGTLMGYVQRGETDDALTGLQNLFVALRSAAESYAPDQLSFGVLIHEVDGVPVTDLSPEGLGPLLARLAVPVGEFTRIVATVKKNSQPADSGISLGLPVR